MDTIELLLRTQAGLRLFACQRSYCSPPRGATVHSVVGQDLFNTDASRSHSGTPHSVRLLWTSDWPTAENLRTHNRHKKQATMPPAEFKPTIPASERPQIHALGRAAIRIGKLFLTRHKGMWVWRYSISTG